MADTDPFANLDAVAAAIVKGNQHTQRHILGVHHFKSGVEYARATIARQTALRAPGTPTVEELAQVVAVAQRGASDIPPGDEARRIAVAVLAAFGKSAKETATT